LRFSRIRQDGSAPNFFQGLGEHKFVYYNVHWNVMHPTFNICFLCVLAWMLLAQICLPSHRIVVRFWLRFESLEFRTLFVTKPQLVLESIIMLTSNTPWWLSEIG